ncbi:MAG: response regulator [Chitinophagaceae bacterium]
MASEKINILVVEDESIVAMDLAEGLERDGYNVVGTADNSAEAMALFTANDVDIVLMDISIIGDKDGIETAINLLKIKEVPVIYLTAFADALTVERVKQTHPAAFLIKPYNINNVRIAIELAINNFAIVRYQATTTKIIPLLPEVRVELVGSPEKEQILQLNEWIFVKYKNHFIKLRINDLLYLEADNNYVNIVTTDKKLAVRLSLGQLLDKLKFQQLARIHRSFAVNMNAIQSFSDQVVVVNKVELPIGRNYREDFLRQFNFS